MTSTVDTLKLMIQQIVYSRVNCFSFIAKIATTVPLSLVSPTASSPNGRLMVGSTGVQITVSFIVHAETHICHHSKKTLFGPACHPGDYMSDCLLSFHTNQHTANLTPSSSAGRGEDGLNGLRLPSLLC